jgi:hypothetical protein
MLKVNPKCQSGSMGYLERGHHPRLRIESLSLLYRTQNPCDWKLNKSVAFYLARIWLWAKAEYLEFTASRMYAKIFYSCKQLYSVVRIPYLVTLILITLTW